MARYARHVPAELGCLADSRGSADACPQEIVQRPMYPER
jgi:hypothetical protein